MNRFHIHRGHMTAGKALKLARRGLASQHSEFRNWLVYCEDGTAWLFRGRRVLRCDWFEFCDFRRKYEDSRSGRLALSASR